MMKGSLQAQYEHVDVIHINYIEHYNTATGINRTASWETRQNDPHITGK